MNSTEFKKILDSEAKSNGFEKAFGGWFKQSSECIVVLCLQKSQFGDYYDLNIKVFVQGMYGNKYSQNGDLVKKHLGDIFTRQPNGYKDALDFETSMGSEERKARIESLFGDFVVPFTNQALSRPGLRMLAEQGKIFLLPAVKEELYRHSTGV